MGKREITEQEARNYIDSLLLQKDVHAYDDIAHAGGSIADQQLLAAVERNAPAEQDLLDAAIAMRLQEMGNLSDVDANRRRSWAAVREAISSTKPRERTRFTRVFAAVAACSFVFFACSIGAAYAFNWRALKQFFNPVADLFGIAQVEEQRESVFRSSEAHDVDTVNRDWNMVPAQINGLQLIPGWIPDRFHFSHSQQFSDLYVVRTIIVYEDETGDALKVALHAFASSTDATSVIMEKEDHNGEHREVAGISVLFAENAGRVIANWLDQNATYQISGNCTVDEMERIVKSIVGG